VVIKRSSGQLLTALVVDLDADDEVRRESAIARLALLGGQAVERLTMVATAGASGRVRAGALQALEGIADRHSLAAAVKALADPDDAVVAAALSVLARLLRTEHGEPALDALASLVIDPARPDAARLAALDALADLPAASIEPILERLRTDESAALRAKADRPTMGGPGPVEELERCAVAGLPPDPRFVRDLVSRAAAGLPLPTLHRLVTVIGEREEAESRGAEREAWLAVRAAVHHVLASRGSRVALYDLRETIGRAKTRLPLEMIAAVSLIGDASCLDALAAAFDRHGEDDWWKRHVGDAFAAIVRREGLTRRHQALKRALSRQPALSAALGRT